MFNKKVIEEIYRNHSKKLTVLTPKVLMLYYFFYK